MKKTLLSLSVATGLAFMLPAHAEDTKTSGGMEDKAQETQASGGMADDAKSETSGGMATDTQAETSGGAAPTAAAQTESMKGHRAVIGDILDTREVQLKGVETKHRLVKIRSEGGEEMVVNVGDATRMPAGDFKKGNKIVAVGKEARINGEPVLYAKYIGDLREAGSMGKQTQ